MLLCCVTLYNFYLYSFALSTERTWFDYISLLIIPCIIYYVTNKETLNLEKIQPKWKVLSSFMHLCIVLNAYEFLSFAEHNRWDFEDSWELNYIEGHWLPLRSFSKYILCFTEEQSFWKNVNRKNSFSGEHLSPTFALFIIGSCQFRLVSWSERRPFIFYECWCY